jgi:hypothetical protein
MSLPDAHLAVMSPRAMPGASHLQQERDAPVTGLLRTLEGTVFTLARRDASRDSHQSRECDETSRGIAGGSGDAVGCETASAWTEVPALAAPEEDGPG